MSSSTTRTSSTSSTVVLRLHRPSNGGKTKPKSKAASSSSGSISGTRISSRVGTGAKVVALPSSLSSPSSPSSFRSTFSSSSSTGSLSSSSPLPSSPPSSKSKSKSSSSLQRKLSSSASVSSSTSSSLATATTRTTGRSRAVPAPAHAHAPARKQKQTWQPILTTTMTTPRHCHTTSTIDEHRVVVVGGLDDQNKRLSTVELFTNDNTFIPLPNMSTERSSHTAAYHYSHSHSHSHSHHQNQNQNQNHLSNSDFDCDSINADAVDNVNTNANVNANASANDDDDISAITTVTFNTSASAAAPATTSTAPGSGKGQCQGQGRGQGQGCGYLYIVGGFNNNGKSLKSVERMDTQTYHWEKMSNMHQPRARSATSVHSNYIYVFGGYSKVKSKSKSSSSSSVASVSVSSTSATASPYLNAVERYDTTNDKWEILQPMKHKRIYHAAITIANRIYIIGGGCNGSVQGILRSTEVYDTTTQTWSIGPAMPVALSGVAAVAVDKFIVVVGGLNSSGEVMSASLILNTETSKWHVVQRPMMNFARSTHTLIMRQSRLVVFGGQGYESKKRSGKGSSKKLDSIEQVYFHDLLPGTMTKPSRQLQVDAVKKGDNPSKEVKKKKICNGSNSSTNTTTTVQMTAKKEEKLPSKEIKKIHNDRSSFTNGKAKKEDEPPSKEASKVCNDSSKISHIKPIAAQAVGKTEEKPPSQEAKKSCNDSSNSTNVSTTAVKTTLKKQEDPPLKEVQKKISNESSNSSNVNTPTAKMGRIELLKRQLKLCNEEKVNGASVGGEVGAETRTLKVVADVERSLVSQRKAQMLGQQNKYQNSYYNQINKSQGVDTTNVNSSSVYLEKNVSHQKTNNDSSQASNNAVKDTMETKNTKTTNTSMNAKSTEDTATKFAHINSTKNKVRDSAKTIEDVTNTDTNTNDIANKSIRPNINNNVRGTINNTIQSRILHLQTNKKNNSLPQLENSADEQRGTVDEQKLQLEHKIRHQTTDCAGLQKESCKDEHSSKKVAELKKVIENQSKMIENLMNQQRREKQQECPLRKDQISNVNPMQTNSELRVAHLERTLDGQKLIIDNLERQQQRTNSDNVDKITKLEKMLEDQKKMCSDFVAKINMKKQNDDVDFNGDSRIKDGFLNDLESQMNELRSDIKEMKANHIKEQYLCKTMVDNVRKQCDEKIARTTMALEDLEHSHNEKIFQLLRAIENLTQASDGLKKEVSALKSVKTGGYFNYLKG